MATMPRNIFIIGPHCTGKTTLVLKLEEIMSSDDISASRPAIIHEVVRHVMNTESFSVDDFGTERWIQLQQCTLTTQADTEEQLQDRWFISDRSILDPIVYAQLRGNSLGDLRETETFRASVKRMQDGLVILCEAGRRAWLSSDSVRTSFDNVRQWEAMTEQFKTLLAEECIPYCVLPCVFASIEERVNFVVTRLA